jgi:hypothetical protein
VRPSIPYGNDVSYTVRAIVFDTWFSHNQIGK